MSEHGRVQTIQDILRGLQGTESLKKLFWTELNYDRVNSPLPRRGWGDQASSALAEDPVLFATGGNDFHVIYARLNSDKLLIGRERPVVSRLLQDHPYALFIFSNSKQDRWHFLNVKYDNDVQRRRLFRRITIGPEERLRTASERLDKINLGDARDCAPITIQKLHDDAFDVELVTKEFFKEYGRIFDEVEDSVQGLRDEERKRLFTQRLFNRVMFIAFIQKKGWLKFDGDTDYLSALWKAYQRDNTIADKSFYRDRLKLLFFSGLNTTNEVNQVGINRGGFLKTLIGEVPYLNGGLFEEDEDDKDPKIAIPDKALKAVLNDLFARFNFTVTESTPLDVEVAVDPEMLGKIFEELVTGRHETGSYYTPKPIVSFMCREALKGCLEAQLPGEAKQAIEEFVDGHNPANLRNAEAVLETLRRIKVCDPACGSGAYLVGMLHELLDLRACLFATKKLDAKSGYERKLEIIQNNLYGVDLDPFAVNIARLRLWLSLSVEFEGQDPPPLPNLDYKVEVGDTVCSPNPAGFQLGLRKTLVDDFLSAKAEYMTAHHAHKLKVRQRISTLRTDIATWAHRAGKDFDWPIEFAEVFLNGGFDVVLANPPYVRMELFKDIKPTLRKNFPQIHAERADLYCYFYARSLELLRESGMLVFISSNKWLRSGYGANLRKYVAQTCRVWSITDFGELPIFESASTFPMIFVAQRASGPSTPIFTQVKSLGSPYPDVKSLIYAFGQQLSPGSIANSNWALFAPDVAARFKRMDESGSPLSEYVQGRIYYGIKTGLDKAFIVDGAQGKSLSNKSRPCAEVIKPLVYGDNVRRWRVDFQDAWLLYMYHSIPMEGLSPILNHLKPYKEQLESRATEQEWYELQQPSIKYSPIYGGPKIIYPEIAKEPRFTLDETGFFPLKTVFSIPSTDLYLLGVLNSSSAWAYLKNVCSVLGDADKGGRLTLQAIYVGRLPIPDAPDSERKEIAALVRKCLDARGLNCEKWEQAIDMRVAALYGIELIAGDFGKDTRNQASKQENTRVPR